MNSPERILKRIMDRTGAYCLSLSMDVRQHNKFSVFLHDRTSCRYGSGQTFEDALAEAEADKEIAT